MPYQLLYSEPALDDLRQLRAVDRAGVLDGIERCLGHTPTEPSRATVKQLRQPAPSEYRLRVGEFRVFYNVRGDRVLILRIIGKAQAEEYLREAP